jgi:glycyl-tRNA synthetase
MNRLVALCKRRGFIFQSSEIYGGINGFWDYGPLGVELKRNIKDAWWHDMVTNPDPGPNGDDVQMVGVDCSLIMNPRVWEASGHVGGFSDPMVDCRECKARFRADQLGRITLSYTQILGSEGASATTTQKDPCFYGLGSHRDIFAANQKAIQRIAKAQVYIDRGGYQYATFCDLSDDDRAAFECPSCKQKGTLTDPRQFNLMFKTYVGALEDVSSVAYLRPETAQGIFANFANVVDTSRVRVPFGIAQIGKAFRNEINPRNYTFRSREFEQMEIEFFCHPSESLAWYEYWRDRRIRWYTELGIQSERLRPREQGEDERAHYAVGCTDIEYLFPFSDEPQELEGVAHRGDFDLSAHQKASGKDLSYYDDERKERYLPHVIEPSAGVDRFALATLCEAYTEDEAPDDKGKMKTRTVMKFHPRLAPIKAAVFPLVNRDAMPQTARAIYHDLRKHMNVFYDEKGAIGRRYRRQDEAGTAFCITVDGQTLEDGTVTVRDRDSLEQVRIDKSRCLEYLREQLDPAT